MSLQWNAHYEICASIFLALLAALFISKRYVRTAQNRMFLTLTFAALGTTLLDVVTAFTLSFPDRVPVPLNYALNILCLLGGQALPVIFLCYLFLIVGRADLLLPKSLCLCAVPVAFSAAAIIASPMTGWIFRFSVDGGYLHGPYWMLIFLPSGVYIATSVIFLVRYRGHFQPIQLLSIFSFDALLMLGMLLQALVFEWTLLTYFCAAISIYLIYLSLEGQEGYMNPITGMQNAEAFTLLAEDRLRLRKPFAAAVLDIDEHDIVRLMHGETLNRALLRNIASTLNGHYGNGNVFMLSEKRYAIIANNASMLKKTLGQVRAQLLRGWLIDGRRFGVMARTAVFRVPGDADTPRELQRVVDRVMRRASDGMLNSVEPNPRDREAANREEAVRRALHRALDENRLDICFQPIYSVKQKRFSGAEVLSRLRDDELGSIPSSEFCEIAERDGSIVRLGMQVFTKMCKSLAWGGAGEAELELVNVNMSALQFLQYNLTEDLTNVARANGVPLNRIVVEITETMPVTMSTRVRENIDILRACGIRFALDDFGTGYSNLSNILEMPFDAIKLDKTLIDASAADGMAFLKNLVVLFHDARFRVVAEGVETREQALKLEEIGCDFLQGYYFAKPMTAEAFAALLRNGAAIRL